ncbi:hypothetical protein TNCV_1442991 [Trichonephila clavipes]|nr:hypothetical protein TNCV_1442991 [Trichonephila clavipes]
MGQLGLTHEGSSSRSQLGLNKMIIRVILIIKCFARSYLPNNWEFRTQCQLTTMSKLLYYIITACKPKLSSEFRPKPGIGKPPFFAQKVAALHAFEQNLVMIVRVKDLFDLSKISTIFPLLGYSG